MKNDSDAILNELIKNSVYRMEESVRMVQTSIDRLSEEEVWKKPNNASNSVANLILHLCGNIRQYAISSLGETEDVRNRDGEFSTSSGYNKGTLLKLFSETIQEAKEVIQNTDVRSLLRKRAVQGYSLSGIGIIVHVVEHLSYHTGQIAYWVKILKDDELGFYNGVDLTLKNKN